MWGLLKGIFIRFSEQLPKTVTGDFAAMHPEWCATGRAAGTAKLGVKPEIRKVGANGNILSQGAIKEFVCLLFPEI